MQSLRETDNGMPVVSRKPASGWVVEPIDPLADLPHVLAVDRTSFAHPWTPEMFTRELDHNDVARIFVIRSPDAPVVGYCSVWVVHDELHINNLAIGPEWRRQGAGATLLEQVLAAGARLGAQRATLEVRASNSAARRLYEGAGFELEGVRKGYYSDPPDDALVLWRSSLGSLETTGTV